MIRQPDWVFETAGQEMRGIDQDAAPYSPGHDLSESQVYKFSKFEYKNNNNKKLKVEKYCMTF